ncbi:hypothetical protein, partial [Pseudoxanthomonas mexicana]
MDILSWEERPFVSLEQMDTYSARDRETAQRFGATVKAAEISNRDYKHRYSRHSSDWAMQPPPSSHIHICMGYLVVRKLDTTGQYETWMPGHVFEELYAAAGE